MNAESNAMYRDGTATEVAELMRPNVVTVRHNETVHDTVLKMTENKISALPVVDGTGECVGIISVIDLMQIVLTTDNILNSEYPHYDDCLWAVELIQRKLGTDKVTDFMTEILTVVQPSTMMHDAACIMLNNQVHHLPVVNSSGRLVGILSSTDFVRLTAGVKPN